MDDPWGSPWAHADTEGSRAPSPAKSDLEPPPRAFLTSGPSPKLPGEPAWGDVGGFNVWATAAPTDAPSPGWGGLGGLGSDLPTPMPQLHLTPSPRREETGFSFDRGAPSPITLPAATSPGPHSAASSSVWRQSSPDPWGGAGPWPGGAVSNKPRSLSCVSDIHLPSGVSVPDGNASRRGEDASKPPATAADEHREAKGPAAATQAPGSANSHEPTLCRSRTRSPSSSSDDSDRGRTRQDSPITSIEEELRVTRQASQQRKPSGKVQDLVYMYDDIANRATSVESAPSGRGVSASRLSAPDVADDQQAEGDGVEAVQDEEDDGGDDTPPISPHDGGPDESGPLSIGVPCPTGGEVDESTAWAEEAAPGRKYAHLHFDVGLDGVDQLFDPAVCDSASPDGSVPDQIISDSYGAISERKTWYRISRQGPMSRHNAADDDSYRRVTWADSTARQDTIKTVRRWMEEESISGRPTLGGGPSRGNAFGWNSDAAPVGLDQVFGKKRESAPPPPKNYALQPLRDPGLSVEVARAESAAPASPALPSASSSVPAAGSGWSSTLAESPVALEKPPPPEPEQTAGLQRPVHKAKDGANQGQAQEPPIPDTGKPSLAPIMTSVCSKAADVDDDDDDEWGEMVASPPSDAPPSSSLFDAFEPAKAGTLLRSSGPSRSSSLPHPPASLNSFATTPVAPAPTNKRASAMSLAAAAPDPWSAVDLSVLDSAASSSKPAAAPASGLDLLSQILPPSTSLSSGSRTPTRVNSLPPVNSTTPANNTPPVRRMTPILPDLPIMASPGGHARGTSTSSQPRTSLSSKDPSVLEAAAARKIVADIPDLSYMLK